MSRGKSSTTWNPISGGLADIEERRSRSFVNEDYLEDDLEQLSESPLGPWTHRHVPPRSRGGGMLLVAITHGDDSMQHDDPPRRTDRLNTLPTPNERPSVRPAYHPPWTTDPPSGRRRRGIAFTTTTLPFGQRRTATETVIALVLAHIARSVTPIIFTTTIHRRSSAACRPPWLPAGPAHLPRRR
jgi:hypothetical protein